MKPKYNLIQIILLASVISIFVLGISLALQSVFAAWAPPGTTPPDSNLPDLINAGNTGQWKNAGMVLNYTGQNTNGLIVKYGNVGIGTENPNSKLHVNNGSLTLDGNYGGSNEIIFRNTDTTYYSGGHQWEIYPAGGSDGSLNFYDRTAGRNTISLGNDGYASFSTGIKFPDGTIQTTAGSSYRQDNCYYADSGCSYGSWANCAVGYYVAGVYMSGCDVGNAWWGHRFILRCCK